VKTCVPLVGPSEQARCPTPVSLRTSHRRRCYSAVDQASVPRAGFQAPGDVNPLGHQPESSEGRDVPKCKSACPHRLNPGVSSHLFSFAMSSLFRDASEELKMPNHLVSQSFVAAMARPRAPSWRARHADMTQMEFIGLVAGWSTAVLVVLALSVFIRFIG
jgi:hypothetical protein